MTEQWGEYMASRAWALLKRQVKERAGDRCERCHNAPLEQIHHRTYIRAYHERLEDLQGLCAPCHEFISGKRDDDPILKSAPVPFEGVDMDELLPLRRYRQPFDHAIIDAKHYVWSQFLALLRAINKRDWVFAERGTLELDYEPDQRVNVRIIFPRTEIVPFQMLEERQSKINILDAFRESQIGSRLNRIEVMLLD